MASIHGRSFGIWIYVLAGAILCGGVSAPTSQPEKFDRDSSFTFEGKPIHPSCLLLLSTDLSDLLPVCTSVDVEGCARSNRYGVPFSAVNGWLRIDDRELLSEGYFQYLWLGQLRNGIHIARTETSGGGSGIFCDLLFLRIEKRRVFESRGWRNETTLNCVGSYHLGDRDDRAIRVGENEVIIRASKDRPSVTIPFLN